MSGDIAYSWSLDSSEKNVIHLVVQKFHVHGLFSSQSWESDRKWCHSRHAFGKKQFLQQNYTSFSLFLVRERIWREFLLLKTCQIDVYSMPCPLVSTMTSLPVTVLAAKMSMKMIFLNDKMCYIFSQKIPKIMNTQNLQTWDSHFKDMYNKPIK